MSEFLKKLGDWIHKFLNRKPRNRIEIDAIGWTATPAVGLYIDAVEWVVNARRH
jgi:predicted secreted protein